MYARNATMLKAGYAPAADVARALSKALSSIHRLVADGHVEGTRDGRALYVKMDSAAAYFDADGNQVMGDVCRKLKSEIVSEGNRLASSGAGH